MTPTNEDSKGVAVARQENTPPGNKVELSEIHPLTMTHVSAVASKDIGPENAHRKPISKEAGGVDEPDR